MAELMIKGMRFYGHHGVYEFERQEGGWYEVDVLMRWTPDGEALLRDELAATVNYEKIYEIVKVTFATPANLIEKLGILIYESLLPLLDEKISLRVTVRKYAPPVSGEVAYTEFVWDGE
jgi:dihydroneopterin aldolase